MTDAFKALIGKVATGATLTHEEASGAFEQMFAGEATPSQMGALLMGLRVRGETVDEIAGAVSAMRSKMLRVAAPARRDRRRRHRRRRVGLVQHFHLRSADRRRRRRSSCQAWQPRPVVAFWRCRRPSGARRQHRSFARGGRPLHRRSRHRLHVRAGASSGHEERRPDARRTRHPHHLQPARTAVESGRREAADGRGILASNGRRRWRRS